MLSVHNPSAKPSAVRLDSKTIICIWNIWEPSRPQKILVYESEVPLNHCNSERWGFPKFPGFPEIPFWKILGISREPQPGFL
jgi:hypothetical protein